VDLYLIWRPDASGVPVGVPPTTKGEKHDMTVGEWRGGGGGGWGNKKSLHMVVDIEVHHK
jgi:hypothetical protein